MAELIKVLEALNAYQGDADTLNAFTAAAEADLGADWPQHILAAGAGLDAVLQEKLNHAYNYYAATASWNEIQGYLSDENPDVSMVAERLPTLEHWLAFFGDAGAEPVRQLRERLNLPETSIATPAVEQTTNAVADEIDFSNKTADELYEIAGDLLGGVVLDKPIEKPMEMISEKAETSEEFQVRQAFQDIDFLDRVQAWTSARCVELGKIEVYAYKFYGFQVDVMEHAKRMISKILEDPTLYPLVEESKEDGLTYLRNKLTSLESDLKVAYDNAQTDVTPLLADDADAEQARALLGGLDTSNTKEFLGPAPDGFEMVDDPYAQIDEERVAKAYNKLEEKVSSTMNARAAAASGRKMSFSLGNKTAKPKGTDTPE